MKFTSVFQSVALASLLILVSCASNSSYTPLLSAEPDIDSSTTRAPRTLRLFFDGLPDVSQSSLSLTGPAGEYPMRGMHTMAADDLMIEITQALIPGEYTVNWTTVVGEDSNTYQGSFNFSVLQSQ